MSEDRLRGRAADSAGPEPQYVAPGRYRVRPDDRLAAGTPAPGEVVDGAGALTHHLNYAQVAPSGGTVLRQVADRPGPLADAIVGHEAMARVQAMDQMRASNPALAPQLAERAPSPVPGPGAPEGTAVPDNGAPFRGTADRWPGVYSREPHSS